MQNEATVIVKSMTRKELAAAYGWSTKTLRGKMELNGLDFGSVRIFTPKQVAQLYEAFGPPAMKVLA